MPLVHLGRSGRNPAPHDTTKSQPRRPFLAFSRLNHVPRTTVPKERCLCCAPREGAIVPSLRASGVKLVFHTTHAWVFHKSFPGSDASPLTHLVSTPSEKKSYVLQKNNYDVIWLPADCPDNYRLPRQFTVPPKLSWRAPRYLVTLCVLSSCQTWLRVW